MERGGGGGEGRVELVEREESEAKGWSAKYSFSTPASASPTSTFFFLFFFFGHLEFCRRWSHFKVQTRISLFHPKVKKNKKGQRWARNVITHHVAVKKHFSRTNKFISNYYFL